MTGAFRSRDEETGTGPVNEEAGTGPVIDQYDTLGRLTDVARPGETFNPQANPGLPPATHYAYDPLGRLQSLADPSQNTTTYQYDLLDRTTVRTDPLGASNLQQYDANGHLTRETDRRGLSTGYAYDTRNRLIAETWNPDANTTPSVNRTYDDLGRLVGANTSTAAISYQYDYAHRRIAETTDFSILRPNVDLTFEYTTDDQRRRLYTKIDGIHDMRNVYYYDGRGRLKSIKRNKVAGGNDITFKWADLTYD